MRGVFITFEGIDGSGKSTQMALLADHLNAEGVPHVVVREPGGTLVGERIRDMLLDRDARICRETEVLLYVAARAQLVADVIRPSLAAGKVVISERFADSTMAYQCYGFGFEREGIETVSFINRFATGGLLPDVTLLLDVPPSVGAQRRVMRRADRIEGRAEEYHHRVREGYLAIARAEPDRVRVIDATRPPGDVWLEVLTVLTPFITPFVRTPRQAP